MPALRPALDFYFDFISPFGYFASLRVDDLARRYQHQVRWHGMLVGVSVLKVMGLPPIPSIPLKGAYTLHDARRYARRHGILLGRDLAAPPGNPLAPGRLFAWAQTIHADQAKTLAHLLFDRYWRCNEDLDNEALQATLTAEAGLDWQRYQAAVQTSDPNTPSPAALLHANVQAATQRGVFGSPFFIVNNEPFFGVEKMETLEDWLNAGGW